MRQADPMPPTEHRRWPRVPEERLFACRDGSDPKERIYFTRNLSGGGCMFESPAAISPGTVLELAFYAPIAVKTRSCENTMQHMCIGAQVRWIHELSESVGHEGGNRYQVGVLFDQIDAQDQACLDEYVRKRLMMTSTQRIGE